MEKYRNGKRILFLFLAMCLLCSLLPEPAWATNEEYDENMPATEVCYRALEEVYRYLDDFYVDQHPEAALETMFGSVSDNTKLQNLADAIAYGCETDREKADAVYDWLDRNIAPNENSSPYPIDVFMNREGNCASNAFLMQDLLRKMGIPAVYSAGWSLPMADYTIGEVVEKNENGFYKYAGHAWCFVYIDGEWVLYDVPYHTKGISDLEYLSGKYFITNVARVTPAYDYPSLIPGHMYVIYDGEKHVAVDDSGAVADGGGVLELYNFYMTNHAESYSTDVDPGYYWYRMCAGEVQPAMEPGESYAGRHWFYQMNLTYGKGAVSEYVYSYTYGEENGYRGHGAIRYMGEDPYFLNGQYAVNIRCLETEPRTIYGCLGIPIGYEGPVMVPSVEGAFEEGALSYHWKSSDQDLAIIDREGILTALEEGFVSIDFSATRNHDGGSAGIGSLELYIYDPNRQESYSDLTEHNHTYEQITRGASCEIGGAVIYTCSQPGCADSYIQSSTPALGHNFSEYVSDNNATKDVNGTKSSHCNRSGCSAVDTLMEHDSKLGQTLQEETTDRGIYKIASDGVDTILQENRSSALRITADSYHGVELKVSDLTKALDQEKGLALILYEGINVSMSNYELIHMLEQCPEEAVVIRMGECGKASLTEQQKNTVAASDAAMLLSAEISGGDGQLLEFIDYSLHIAVPFSVSDGTENEYQIYYLDQDGYATTTSSYYTGGPEGYICADVRNNGIYLVAKNIPESLVKEPKVEPELELPVVIAAATAVVVVALIVTLIVVKKKKATT